MAYKQLGSHDFIEQKLSGVQTEINNLTNDINTISTDLTNTEFTVESLTSTMSNVQDDLQAINSNILQISETVNLIAEDIPELQTDVLTLNVDILDLSSSTTDPFQLFTSEITSQTNTYVITRSDGVYPYISISANSAISIDSSSYPLSGTNSVKVCLSNVNNSEITFGQDDVEYIEPFEIKPNTMTTIYFERTGQAEKWTAVTWP